MNFHFVREKMQVRELLLADVMTKSIPTTQFEDLKIKLTILMKP